MADTNGVGSQDNARQHIPPDPNRSDQQSVLPPFSGELGVDKKLKLSNGEFREKIVDFFEGKTITPHSQLTTTPAFPTPHVLARFANMAYEDYKKGETDDKYVERLRLDLDLALPDGWQLLTTASNATWNNGYFGGAYWHPEHQQVVIAHRGTKPLNVGADISDVFGVLFKHHVPQMGSASTFAHRVVEVLREFDNKSGANFQVFFTGHSLGGWLAQITTFTTEYLNAVEDTFQKTVGMSQTYHAHTVVFDSPGCKEMLTKMADTFDVRHLVHSLHLQQLDITSYLSAPNRINTCNAHIGTVYRIFIDISDMGRWQERTGSYNVLMHSMERIVNVFDPNTGQVCTDEQGQLKVQVVADWPVNVGIWRSREYIHFFEWAERLNNYHPEIKDEELKLGSYYPIRYQTKKYNETVTSLSTFSQQERQFLVAYNWIRQLPEFFKPKEMFSVIRCDKAQEAAVTILESFEIDNKTIRCTNVSALQALIPYVRRLLQLYPDIQKNTSAALSAHEITNRVYQIETKCYIEKFHKSPLKFKPDALNLGYFLESDEQKVLQLRVVGGDAWTGLIKVYQGLEKAFSLSNRVSEGQCTIVSLGDLLHVNRMVSLNRLLESKSHLLMISCEASQLSGDETKKLIKSLFKTVGQPKCGNIILITQSEGGTFLRDIAKKTVSNGFVTRDEKLAWADLTTSSQEKLLRNAVSFQGTKVALYQLISPDSAVTNSLCLADLLGEKCLEIGEEPREDFQSNGYSEKCYIDRTFQHQVTIEQNILNDQGKQKFPDLLARSEQEFKQLCQNNPQRNVHWLQTETSGELFWCQSQGSLQELHQYIASTHSSHTYTTADCDTLFEQALRQRVMLIADTAGMGKSTVLTHLCGQMKRKFPSKWVVRIDLNDHTKALKALKEEHIDKEKQVDSKRRIYRKTQVYRKNQVDREKEDDKEKQIDMERAVQFVSRDLLELKTNFEKELFKHCCEQNHKVKIVIILDGVDEVSPKYKQTVIHLLQALRQTAVEQLWVTTRPHLRRELEDELQQLSYTLEPFSEQNQIDFLTRFWGLQDWFTEMDNEKKVGGKTKLEAYAEELVKGISQSLSDKGNKMAGIPLQCRMLAEAFDEEAKDFYQSDEFKIESNFKIDIFGLYEKFIETKYDIYWKEKFKAQGHNAVEIKQRENLLRDMRKVHQLLAMKVLFDEEQVSLFPSNGKRTLTDEELTGIGIVQIDYDSKPHFIHRTFAEYYVADLLVEQLAEGLDTFKQVQNFLLHKIFQEKYHHVIRDFIDGCLSECEPSRKLLQQYGELMDECRDDVSVSEPSEEVLEQYENQKNDFWSVGVLIFHQAAREDNANIIGFLLKSVQAGEHMHTVKELEGEHMHTVKELEGEHMHTVKELAGQHMHTVKELEGEHTHTVKELEGEHMHTVKELAGQHMHTVKQLLLAQDQYERTAWHLAAEWGNTDLLQKLWEWATETLTPEERRDKFLLGKVHKITSWQMAAKRRNMPVLEKLWEWAKQELTAGEIKSNLFFAKGISGRSVWQDAAMQGNMAFVEKLWEWVKQEVTPEEFSHKLLLGTERTGTTVWHGAAEQGNIALLKTLWHWAEEKLTPWRLKNELLLGKSNWKENIWHVATESGNIQVLEEIWTWSNRILTTEELNNKLLLGKDRKKRTAWHLAAEKGNTHILQTLWQWAKEKLRPQQLKNELLFGRVQGKGTAWDLAAKQGKVEMFSKLHKWAEEELTPVELKEKSLFIEGRLKILNSVICTVPY